MAGVTRDGSGPFGCCLGAQSVTLGVCLPCSWIGALGGRRDEETVLRGCGLTCSCLGQNRSLEVKIPVKEVVPDPVIRQSKSGHS